MPIPQSFIQELLTRADVVDIVGRFVQLKKSGANFTGLCPFHSEKSPSFSVSPTKQFYHCFGCGKHGNAIGFLMEHAGMGFVEAVNDLAGQYGLRVPQDESSAQEREQAGAQRQKQVSLHDVLEKAAQIYRKRLKESPQAVNYFQQRGVSGEIARQFGLGYAPAGWRSLASAYPDYEDPLLVESGLVIEQHDETSDVRSRYDRFRDRVMFPIRNVKGECIGFGGRVLGDEKPKYLNSPETPIFSKGRELYGLFEARSAVRDMGYVLVTEGYMDVVALSQLGFPNAVATLGTACTTEHLQKLFRHTDTVVFSFDGDAAGQRAARKAMLEALPFANDVRTVKFLFLPIEHDPDSFIRAHGKEAFTRYVSEALPLSRFLVDTARETHDLATPEGRAHMASIARTLWDQLPDGGLKIQLLGEIAALAQLTTRELTDLWGRGRSASRPGSTFRYQNNSASRIPDGHQQPFSASKSGASRVRTAPASRADHAARLLLTKLGTLEHLSAEDHALLSELPAPHGSLFGWLERQFHEHGTQPWAALREGLRGLDMEALALRLMDRLEPDDGLGEADARTELHNLLHRMHIDRLKGLETLAIEASKTDPNALTQYRHLQQRRRQLEADAGNPHTGQSEAGRP